MPDEQLASMKAQVYKDPRPPEYFDKFHQRSRTREPNWVYEAVRLVTVLYGLIFFRVRCIGSDSVPAHGRVILAPNHFSFMDHFFTGAFIRRRVRFMAKSQLFTKPMQWIYSPGGVFPVRRGHYDEDAFITAEAILEREAAIVMYCEGGRSRTGKVSDRARPGIGRLVLQSGAPVVPIAIYGSQRVRNWKRLQFPKVIVQYGEPLHFPVVERPSREQQQEVADEILGAIRTLYGDLEQHGVKQVRRSVRAQRRGAAKAVSAGSQP
ncbi:MAG TPA: lysophospholipid acyltransferase family protein [Conexibacter sp.]|nr:lysophospholipid acyltransferase family protein [Conexibacter sp.]